MSWQEDLRALDSALAAGRISADEYRTRRDTLLSSAVTVTHSSPVQVQQPAQSETTQFIPPISVSQPLQAGQDRTQIVAGQGENPDKTQIVAGPDRTQIVRPGGDADRTQHVAPVGQPYPHYGGGGPMRPPPSPPQGFPAQGQDQFGWNTPENDPQSPWGGAALSARPSWAQQGPEVFEDVSSSGGTKKPLIIAAVLVLVIAIAAGAYFLFFNNTGSTPGAGPSTQAPPPSVTERPKDDLEIAELPGNAGVKPDFQTFADIETAGVLTTKENDVYKTAGAGKCRLANASLPEGVNALVLTVETGSAGNAATAAQGLVKLQGEFGMKPYSGTAPAGVTVTQIEKTSKYPAAIRGHYVHGKTVVRVQAAGSELAKISKAFDEILAAQLETLPVDG